jgi:hypothetical protein
MFPKCIHLIEFFFIMFKKIVRCVQYVLLFNQPWFEIKPHALIMCYTIKDATIGLKFNHNYKNVQIMDVTFWCNTKTSYHIMH